MFSMLGLHSSSLGGDQSCRGQASSRVVNFLPVDAADCYSRWSTVLSGWMYGNHGPRAGPDWGSALATSTFLRLELPISRFLSGCGAEYGEESSCRAWFTFSYHNGQRLAFKIQGWELEFGLYNCVSASPQFYDLPVGKLTKLLPLFKLNGSGKFINCII